MPALAFQQRLNALSLDLRVPLGSRSVAYVAGNAVTRTMRIRPLGETEGADVSGSEDAYLPFFSPDSRMLAFVSNTRME